MCLLQIKLYTYHPPAWYNPFGACLGSIPSLLEVYQEVLQIKRVMVHHGISGRKFPAMFVTNTEQGNSPAVSIHGHSLVDGASQTCPFEMAAASGVPIPVGHEAFQAEQMRRNLYQFAAKQHTLSKANKALDDRLAVMMAYGTLTGKVGKATIKALLTKRELIDLCDYFSGSFGSDCNLRNASFGFIASIASTYVTEPK